MEEKKNCPYKGLLRALIIVAAVIGTLVAVEVVLERVFKKYLKVTIELDDIENLDDDCDCCDCEFDDDCICDCEECEEEETVCACACDECCPAEEADAE